MEALDMIVPLYQDFGEPAEGLPEDLLIRRAYAFELDQARRWSKENFPEWEAEFSASFRLEVPKIWLGVRGTDILGMCAYDVVAKGVVGPLACLQRTANVRLGTRLLRKVLISMRYEGYAYGILGWVSPRHRTHYSRMLAAYPVPNSAPDTGIFKNAILSTSDPGSD